MDSRDRKVGSMWRPVVACGDARLPLRKIASSNPAGLESWVLDRGGLEAWRLGGLEAGWLACLLACCLVGWLDWIGVTGKYWWDWRLTRCSNTLDAQRG